jgi:RNA recognition motif-containing protein
MAAYNKKSFTHNILNMLTVPVYQLSILQAFYAVSKTEDIAASVNCSGLTFAQRRAWCYVEVIGFFVNIIQLMVYLIGNLKITKGIGQIFFAIYDFITLSCCKPSKGSSESKALLSPPKSKSDKTGKEDKQNAVTIKPEGPPKSESKAKSKIVFVQNLSMEYTEDKVRKKFESCGAISEVRMASNEKTSSTPHAYIRFKSLESAEKAINDFEVGELVVSSHSTNPSGKSTVQETIEENKAKDMFAFKENMNEIVGITWNAITELQMKKEPKSKLKQFMEKNSVMINKIVKLQEPTEDDEKAAKKYFFTDGKK